MSLFNNFFGGYTPNLNSVTAMPGLNIGDQLHSGVGMTNSTPLMQISPNMDFMKMLQMMQQGQVGSGGGGEPMMAAPIPQFTPGGGSFARDYVSPGMIKAGLLGGGL